MPRQSTSTESMLGAPDSALLTIYQGDDKRWLFKLKMTGGAPFNLTGYTAAMQFRTDVADVDQVVDATPEVEVTNPAGGEITVTLRSEQSVLLTEQQYVWDLEITLLGETPVEDWTTTIAAGLLGVTKEVTRLP